MILSEQEIFKLVAEGKMTKLEALEQLKLLNSKKKEAVTEEINEPSQSQGLRQSEDIEKIQELIAEIISNILHMSIDEMSLEINFKDLGVDSISGLEIVRDINREFNLNMDAVVLYDYSTVLDLAKHISEQMEKAEHAVSSSGADGSSDVYNDPYYLKLRQKYIQKEYSANSAAAEEKDVPVRKLQLKHDKQVTESAKVPLSAPHLNIDEEAIRRRIAEIVGGVLHISEEDMDYELSFKDLGVDSISGIEIVRDINREFNLNMDAVILYDHSTTQELGQFIAAQLERASAVAAEPEKAETKAEDVYHDPYYLELRHKYLQKEHKDAGNQASSKISLKNKIETPVVSEEPQKTAKPLKLKGKEEIQRAAEPENEAVNVQQTTAKVITSKDMSEHRISTLQMQNDKGGKDYAKETEYQGIAIIGMSGRFPNARNLKEYWKNLRDGIDCIMEIPKERWDIDKYYDPDMKAPNKTCSRWFGMVPDADKFDPLFFNISPVEAETMDPQQRIFLEEAWKALEDAGYSDKAMSSLKCGVFVGTAHSDYQQIVNRVKIKNVTDTFTGLSPSILPARISYFMNLIGPSIALDTACSSSLVAIHQACQSVINGECEMALAGGVRLMLTPDLQVQTSKAGMISPTGKCRAFDQNADGIVMGEGVGVIVLKQLSKALEDGDNIYGIIKASGLNQDGRTNGITAPSAQSQAMLEKEVYSKGGINPADITLVEAHGTGTKLGDPIEVKALKESFGKYTDKRNYCAIGSVKANIGHTTMAAGVASVIKILLAMKHGQIPPLINFNKINEHIDIENSPFYVNTKLIDWKPENGKPKLATVSSFGFSGTNCHIVIQEPPKVRPSKFQIHRTRVEL